MFLVHLVLIVKVGVWFEVVPVEVFPARMVDFGGVVGLLLGGFKECWKEIVQEPIK